MRVSLHTEDSQVSKEELENSFLKLAEPLQFTWSVSYGDKKQNIAILVSHTSYNLYDLRERQKEGKLDCNINMVISNHSKLKYIADIFSTPFYYLPVTRETKKEQETKIIGLLESNEIDLIIMARYMQILSSDFIAAYSEKIINIHHSFLLAFQGTRPYQGTYDRGVKLIGATTHHAKEDFDEGSNYRVRCKIRNTREYTYNFKTNWFRYEKL